MTTIQDNLNYIESELQALVAHCRTQISEPLYAPMAYAFEGGGKRLRPLLVLMVADMYGKDRTDFIKAALALEIYHNFTLLHDDVMDHSEMRRNRPSVPAQFGIAQTHPRVPSGSSTCDYGSVQSHVAGYNGGAADGYGL